MCEVSIPQIDGVAAYPYCTILCCIGPSQWRRRAELESRGSRDWDCCSVPLMTGVNNHKERVRKQNETRHRERIGKLETDKARIGHAERRAGGVESANAELDWGWWCDEVTVESQSENLEVLVRDTGSEVGTRSMSGRVTGK